METGTLRKIEMYSIPVSPANMHLFYGNARIRIFSRKSNEEQPHHWVVKYN